jgi:hypothetical protein
MRAVSTDLYSEGLKQLMLLPSAFPAADIILGAKIAGFASFTTSFSQGSWQSW